MCGRVVISEYIFAPGIIPYFWGTTQEFGGRDYSLSGLCFGC